MPRRNQWRVRVQRLVEVYVDVEAFDALDAEAEAAKVPGVKSVFAKSAMRTDLEDVVPRARLVEGAEDDG
jgi:hypothetical protein